LAWVDFLVRVEGFVGGFHGGVNVVRAHVWGGGPDLATAGVNDIEAVASLGLNPVASDQRLVPEEVWVFELSNKSVVLQWIFRLKVFPPYGERELLCHGVSCVDGVVGRL
jgi:hypothetical protein